MKREQEHQGEYIIASSQGVPGFVLSMVYVQNGIYTATMETLIYYTVNTGQKRLEANLVIRQGPMLCLL